MRVLVLDTIHGGSVLAEALVRHGDDVDAVDVYRGKMMSADDAEKRKYDIITAPVHLDPDHPLVSVPGTHLTHHQMTARLLPPCSARIIEITGARGKTTTAFAVASALPGKTILHTSAGTFVYPEKRLLFKKSITPASLLFAVSAANAEGADWIVAEESLGVCGTGDIGILTSDADYRIAAGKKSALSAKLKSLAACKTLLVPDSLPVDGAHTPEKLVIRDGCRFSTKTCGSFENRLAEVPGYADALSFAAAAAVLLHLDVTPLARFTGCEGRMIFSVKDGVPVLDNANSGTNRDNIIAAAAYLKTKTGKPYILVTGSSAHTVCEGLSDADIEEAVYRTSPASVIRADGRDVEELMNEAVSAAKKQDCAVLFCVKTWR